VTLLTTVTQVGDIDVIAVSDGVGRLPKAYFPQSDWTGHDELFDADGTMHIPIGCFIIRTGDTTVLVDAGIAPVDVGWATGGSLPASLESHGIHPGDIDIVVCTHLHQDHAGWLVDHDKAYFPNAEVRSGLADWEAWVANAATGDRMRAAMLVLDREHRLDPIDADHTHIAAGVTTRSTPGYTPGHQTIVISSGDDRLLLLGDVITCPLQLDNAEWQAISDVDTELASQSREALWRELEGTETRIAAAHFPGLNFGRVLRGKAALYFS
jgi:glyoxylase-like metal-dependent hydrolase (beta-lactamase superfamily II)